ncbi:MAG TPA: hypothetical protein VFC51_04370 [Chloroflexota bacterium]|nr:hypothetical protein [Chloroflexota bacterium]
MISFAASPPQESLPYGRWAETLADHFRAACAEIDTEGEDLGEPGEVAWFPDRSYAGRTFVPAVARTTTGYELFGYVSFREGSSGEQPAESRAPSDFHAHADFTSELAESNPDWKLDLNDEVIGSWRGEEGNSADMTLVWGVPLIPSGEVVTAELANLAVDQCELVEDRFTLIAPDNYRQDFLEIKLWSKRGQELAAESLYVEDDEEEEEGE